MTETRLHPTPLGLLALGCTTCGLCLCQWITDKAMRPMDDSAPEILLEAARQIDEYIACRRTEFSIPISLSGTPFQKKVWEALSRIPYGSTITYAQLAASVGIPKAYRAVAQACHVNPIALVIPCHRVIGSDGSLTGYAGGLAIKRRLLALESSATPPITPYI